MTAMKTKEEFPSIRLPNENLLLGLFLVIMLILSLCGRADAQELKSDTVQWVQVETKDGNKYVGRLISKDRDAVVIATQSAGTIRVAHGEIVALLTLEPEKLKSDGYWRENYQATRNFWAPTAYGLRAGESYYQNVWVLFNQFSYGISNNFSLGLGLIPTFLFGSSSVPIWVTPKFSIPITPNKLNVGVGAMIGTTSLGEKGNGFGILYGVTTLGSRDNNVTVGLGYGYSGSSMAKKPMISFSALQRISAKGYFITENYLLPKGDGYQILLSLGGRRLVNRTGIDFGLVIPIQETGGQLIGIPWLGITAPLDKRY